MRGKGTGRGEVFWQGQMDLWQVSGQSQGQYCLEQGLSYTTFQYWRSRLQKQPLRAVSEPSVSVVQLGRALDLTRLVEQAEASDSSGLTIHCGPFRVTVDTAFHTGALGRVLETLRMV